MCWLKSLVGVVCGCGMGASSRWIRCLKVYLPSIWFKRCGKNTGSPEDISFIATGCGSLFVLLHVARVMLLSWLRRSWCGDGSLPTKWAKVGATTRCGRIPDWLRSLSIHDEQVMFVQSEGREPTIRLLQESWILNLCACVKIISWMSQSWISMDIMV